jgi:hypothetical protein
MRIPHQMMRHFKEAGMKKLPLTVDWCGECPYNKPKKQGYYSCLLQSEYYADNSDFEEVYKDCPLEEDV